MNDENKSIHEFNLELIHEYFSNLERQGPGSPEVTAKAMMTRRHFMKTFGLVASAFAMGGCSSLRTRQDQRLPNIVMLISDDQGWDDYGFMGHSQIQTPRIDRLAAESLLFTRGYVTAPLCCPSLSSMITGLHPHQHKITSNDPPFIGKRRGWPPERLAQRFEMHDYMSNTPTLPRMLGDKGYQSLQTGKWWMGNYSRGGFTHGMTHGDPAKGGRHGDAGLTIGRKTMQPIYDFIDEAKNTPFFLWYAPMLPHLPHNPPARLLKKYVDKTASIHLARYWAMCEWWDEGCGQILDYLDKKGLANDTIVLYVCDNGWVQREDSKLMTPRSKGTRYEAGIRTPIMVRWPGKVTPKQDDKTIVSSIDLATTILSACGLSTKPDMQGVDLLDPRALRKRKAVCGAEYGHNATDIHNPLANLQYLWVVEKDWKLILPAGQAAKKGTLELFNVVDDPREKTNLAIKHPHIVRKLRKRIEAWWPEGAATAEAEFSGGLQQMKE